MLSPENYIRKKARSLPVFECLVSSDWKETKLLHVVVSRSHTNGNITACFYLVDLLLLGVKDTDYLFNRPLFEYKERIDEISDGMNLIPVTYELAHNIIFTSIDFAGSFGFSPHKDFSSITLFMLEEDTENIELIDIECGHDGKPAYMRSPFESDQDSERIIRKLEKNAGIGNFIIIDNVEDDYDEFDEDDDDEQAFNEFDGRPSEEKQQVFNDLSERFDSLSDEEIKRYSDLISSIFEDLSDPNETIRHYNNYLKDLNFEVLSDAELPDELLGVSAGSLQNAEEIKGLFIDIYDSYGVDSGNDWKKWKKFRKLAQDIPAVFFLELLILRSENPRQYYRKLKKYNSIYPDYYMIRLLWLTYLVISELPSDNKPAIKIGTGSFFKNRKSIHRIELSFYLMYLLFSLALENNPSGISALTMLSEKFESLSDRDLIVVLNTISIVKMKIVINHFSK